MKHSTKAPTKAEKARLNAIHSLPCLCCMKEIAWGAIFTQPFPTECHHLTDKGTRKLSGGHSATVILCGWHHSGWCRDGDSVATMTERYGPSLANRKKSFVKRYGSERQLLDETDALLLSNRDLIMSDSIADFDTLARGPDQPKDQPGGSRHV